MNLIAELDRTGRAVADADLGGATAHVVELRRRLHASVADVWAEAAREATAATSSFYAPTD
jgi:hypothetical protein